MKSDRRIIVFLVVAFVWSWIAWLIGLRYLSPGINDQTVRPFITCLFLAIYGPTLSAIGTSWYFDGFTGVTALLKKLTIWKAPLGVYLTILFLPPVLTAGSIGLYVLFYGNAGHFDAQAIHMVPVYIWAALQGGPLGEEMGWRGFLLPRLQQRYSPLKSSLIIGAVWFCWHIPLFFAPIGTAVSGAPITLSSILFFYVFVTCLACIYTWLVNRSNGSLLVAVLIHLSFNAGLLMLFFPDLAAHSKTLNYLSAPLLVMFTVALGIKTRFGYSPSGS